MQKSYDCANKPRTTKPFEDGGNLQFVHLYIHTVCYITTQYTPETVLAEASCWQEGEHPATAQTVEMAFPTRTRAAGFQIPSHQRQTEHSGTDRTCVESRHYNHNTLANKCKENFEGHNFCSSQPNTKIMCLKNLVLYLFSGNYCTHT